MARKKKEFEKYRKKREKDMKKHGKRKFKGKIDDDFGEEIKVTNREATLGKVDESKKGFLSKILKGKKLEREDDEHGLEDIQQKAIVNDESGYLFKGGKWKVFIKNFQDMYDIDILGELTDRPFELVGFGKKMDEKIKSMTEGGSTTIGKPDRSNMKKMKLKDVTSSISRRQKKITHYWKKGQKKNALHIACKLHIYNLNLILTPGRQTC